MVFNGENVVCPRYLFPSCFSRSRIDSKTNGLRRRLGYLQVGDDVIDKHCIALDSRSSSRYEQAYVPSSHYISNESKSSSRLIRLTLHKVQHTSSRFELRLVLDLPPPKTSTIKRPCVKSCLVEGRDK